MISLRKLSNFEDLPPSIRQEWDRLVTVSGGSVFQTLGWNSSWWKIFGQGSRLELILALREGRLVGVAALELSGEGNLRFVGGSNHASDYCDFVTDPGEPGVLPALLEAIAEDKRWRSFDWFNAPGASRHLKPAEDWFRGRAAGNLLEKIVDAPARRLGDPKLDQEVLAKKSLKRHFNSFQKSGKLECRVCDSVQEIDDWLEAFFQQHRERRALTGDESQFNDPRQKGFYREVLRELFPTGVIHFAVILFNEEPIAFHFGFVHEGRFIWYKPSFNVRFLKQSPGEVLLKFLFEHAISRGLKEFDFTVGEESFKYRFATEIRANHRFRVFRSPAQYWLARARLLAKRARALLRRSSKPKEPA